MTDVPTQDEINGFEMPDVALGTPVTFYLNGLRDGTEPRIGFVLRISRSGRNVVIRTAEGGHYESVRHINDPKLRINSDHRENGAWDFTDFHKAEEKKRQLIDARIAALEHSATDKIIKSASTAKKEVTYSELREQALSLGIEFKGNPKRKWLEQEVAKVRELEPAV